MRVAFIFSEGSATSSQIEWNSVFIRSCLILILGHKLSLIRQMILIFSFWFALMWNTVLYPRLVQDYCRFWELVSKQASRYFIRSCNQTLWSQLRSQFLGTVTNKYQVVLYLIELSKSYKASWFYLEYWWNRDMTCGMCSICTYSL